MTTDKITTDHRTARQRHPGRPRDLRRIWRTSLAIVAPIPMLAMGVNYLLQPLPGDVAFPETVAATAEHLSLVVALQLVAAPFVLLLIPATGALICAARRGAPRLTTAGGLLAILGFCAGFGFGPNDTLLALITVQQDLDVATMTRLDDALWEQSLASAMSLLFILGLTVGLSLLGAALWRGRSAPRWTCLALIIGTFTHPFMPNQTAAGLGLLVAAVGFAGASWALLRMGDEAFDLAPSRTVPTL